MKLDPDVFLDSAYLIALAQTGDTHHTQAARLAEVIAKDRTRVVTNQAVLLEVGSSLSRLRYRKMAVGLLNSLTQSELVEVVPVTNTLAREGWNLFQRRPDKEWSWADCISFVIMQERGLRQALTTDEHFEQAGFTALLRH